VNDDRGPVDPPLGEVTPATKNGRPWRNGAPPDVIPEQRVIGSRECIADGDTVANQDIPYTSYGGIPSLWLPPVSSPFGKGLAAWHRPEGLPGEPEGTPISTWNDSSGLGRHLAQDDPVRQPLLHYADQGSPSATASFDNLFKNLTWTQLLETTRDYSLYVSGFLPSNPPFGPFPILAIRHLPAGNSIWAVSGFTMGAGVGSANVSTLLDPLQGTQYGIWWVRRKGRRVELGWDRVMTFVGELPLIAGVAPGCVAFGRIEVSQAGPLVREVLLFNAETIDSLHSDVLAYLRSRSA